MKPWSSKDAKEQAVYDHYIGGSERGDLYVYVKRGQQGVMKPERQSGHAYAAWMAGRDLERNRPPTIYQRLYAMMVKLRVPVDHPSWHTTKGMIYHIAFHLNIHRQKTGEIIIDEDTVSWLEAAMPVKRKRA